MGSQLTFDTPNGHLSVSRETNQRLEEFSRELERWSRAINLVSASSVSDIWTRHIGDSAQLMCFLSDRRRVWVDVGTGGGLPGLVLAIIAAETSPGMAVHLVEKDQRKAEFLRSMVRRFDLSAIVHACLIKDLDIPAPDVISARALAPLPELLCLVEPICAPHTNLLFLKGKNLDTEISNADVDWRLAYQLLPSVTDAEAKILHITGIQRRP